MNQYARPHLVEVRIDDHALAQYDLFLGLLDVGSRETGRIMSRSRRLFQSQSLRRGRLGPEPASLWRGHGRVLSFEFVKVMSVRTNMIRVSRSPVR